ncbi:MAG: hypothetical protein H7Y15_19750 [Pseudonocardia sp.]|nr:hypothetical protein [Pseudonocardia sp.]
MNADSVNMLNPVTWRHDQHPERITAFCAVSTAATRYSDARYAATGTEPGSPAWVHANDLRTTLDDRRVAHLLLMQDPSQPPGHTIPPEDIQRSGPCTVEASLRYRPFREAEQARRAAEHAQWLNYRRRTDSTRLDYIGPPATRGPGPARS